MSGKGKLREIKFKAKERQHEDAVALLKGALETVEKNKDLDRVYIIMRSSKDLVCPEMRYSGAELEMLGALDIAMSDHRYDLRNSE